mmetsp:Transcript_121795/g.350089  ORF Transcript_121795/g.350089 Transcript_121795/m.350089 type:complete len:213 (+) Transcript_121795:1151-1789(+)
MRIPLCRGSNRRRSHPGRPESARPSSRMSWSGRSVLSGWRRCRCNAELLRSSPQAQTGSMSMRCSCCSERPSARPAGHLATASASTVGPPRSVPSRLSWTCGGRTMHCPFGFPQGSSSSATLMRSASSLRSSSASVCWTTQPEVLVATSLPDPHLRALPHYNEPVEAKAVPVREAPAPKLRRPLRHQSALDVRRCSSLESGTLSRQIQHRGW